MRKIVLLASLVAMAAAFQPGVAAQAGKPLNIQFIDVEGGQATLIVAPSGQSMLVDTGFPGNGGRDPDRILAAVKQAGLSRIDFLVITHFHLDHVGNAATLADRIPIGTFVDHGPNVEEGSKGLYDGYVAATQKGRHLVVKPGDKIPIEGLDVTVVSAAGQLLAKPLPGGGGANASCASYKPKDPDPSENAQSLGIVIAYGKFRLIDLGDLTWNKEHDLVCPDNRVGTVDVYLTTHHGLAQSNAPVIVQALRPRVAIMNNGAKKGGSPEAWTTIHSAPGLQDLWQLHYAVDGGKDHNVNETFIANVDETTAHPITLSAQRDGSFTVTNARNGMSKTYQANP